MNILSSSTVPLDRLKIATDLLLRSDLFVAAEDADKAFAAAGHQWFDRASRSYDGSAADAFVRIHLLDYQSITLICRRSATGWRLRSLEINPRAILNGHAGRSLDETGFVLALSILKDQVGPLLADPAESWKVIPGIGDLARNPAYWSSLEIPCDFYDPARIYWAAFSNISYPRMRDPMRYKGETMQLGGKNSELSITVYRRDLKLKKNLRKLKGKLGDRGIELREPFETTRVELRLKGAKLVSFLGHGNNALYRAGRKVLVRFTASDLIDAYLRVMRQVRGIGPVSAAPEHLPKDNDHGRMLGLISAKEGLELDRMLSLYRDRFQASVPTMWRMRKAAYDERARHVPFDLEKTINVAAFDNQPEHGIPILENGRKELHFITDIDDEIRRAYGCQNSID